MNTESWETRNVSLWLNNDEYMYYEAKRFAEVSGTADAFEERIVDTFINTDDMNAGIAKDFILAGISAVDWDEIWNDFREEE